MKYVEKSNVTCDAKPKSDVNLKFDIGRGEGSSGKCVFPFYYEGVEYRYCAMPELYGGVGFCSFTTIYEGKWGYCTPECPTGNSYR